MVNRAGAREGCSCHTMRVKGVPSGVRDLSLVFPLEPRSGAVAPTWPYQMRELMSQNGTTGYDASAGEIGDLIQVAEGQGEGYAMMPP